MDDCQHIHDEGFQRHTSIFLSLFLHGTHHSFSWLRLFSLSERPALFNLAAGRTLWCIFGTDYGRYAKVHGSSSTLRRIKQSMPTFNSLSFRKVLESPLNIRAETPQPVFFVSSYGLRNGYCDSTSSCYLLWTSASFNPASGRPS